MKEKDIVFIRSTLEALNQYDQFKDKLEQSYARTLFLNACVGLLFIPRSRTVYDKLPDEIVSKEKWGIDASDIEECIPNSSVQKVVRHLRNSIAHNRFDYDCSRGISIPIEEISFEDFDVKKDDKKKIRTFKAKLRFEDFNQFVLKVARFAIEQ